MTTVEEELGDIPDNIKRKSYRHGGKKEQAKPNGPNGTHPPQQPWFKWPWEFEPARPATLINGLIGSGDEVLIYGAPESGKTFYLVDKACCWACGDSWRGRSVERGVVVYLAGERKRSVQSRINAWSIRNGRRLGEMPILVLNRALNLLKPDMASVEEVAEEIKRGCDRFSLPLASIIADTVHSLSPGSKEDAQSFGILMDQVRRMRDLTLQNPSLVYCHHTGKDEDRGARGSNTLPAGMSLVACISTRMAKWHLIDVEKNSDLPDEPHIEPFIIENVTVAHLDSGEPVKVGVHVAVPMTEVPRPPEEELRKIAAHMHKDGKSVRAIAKHVGRPSSTVQDWLKPYRKKAKADGPLSGMVSPS